MAPKSCARPPRAYVPGRRSALHRLRNNGPPPDPELAGAAPVLGALEPRRRLPALQLRWRRPGCGPEHAADDRAATADHRRAAAGDRAAGREACPLRRPGREAPPAGDPLAVGLTEDDEPRSSGLMRPV